MSLVRPIITSLLILYIWIWIINTIFSQKKIKIWITLKIFWLWIIMVGSLFAYTYLFKRLPQFSTLQMLPNKTDTQSLIVFIVYCTICVSILAMVYKSRYKRIFQIIIIWSLFFAGIAYGGYFTGINTLLLYYFISAYAEEYLKYSWGNSMFVAAKETNESNLIFFCILVWLWFSAVENILYIVNTVINHKTINIINVLIGRGLISTLIHIVSTSLIAYIMLKIKRKNIGATLPIVLGIISGFWIHSLYNISLQYHLTYITIPMVVLTFFLMTYLSFQSDIIYKEQTNTLWDTK